MDDSKIYVGLDIGTSSIKVVVAESDGKDINVIGVSSERSEGVSRGVIVDIDKAANSIKKAVDKAETQSNMKINDVIVSIPSNMIEIIPCQGMIAVGSQSKEITENDVKKVMSAAMVQNLPSEREIVTLTPNKFTVDGFSNIRDPRGMIGVRLEMNGILYTAPKTIVHNTETAVKKAGLNIIHKVISPISLSQVALNDGERDFGSVIIDMGAGQSSASVIHDKSLKFTTTDFEGGNHITHDISVVLNTTIENASQIKLYYGSADSASASEDEYFSVEVVGKNEPEKVSMEYLSEIIEARVEQIFQRLKNELDKTNALNLPGGIILTGGVSATPGIENIAKKIFGVSVKTYVPDQMGMRYPSYANAYGLVTYGNNLTDIEELADSVVSGRVVESTEDVANSSVMNNVDESHIYKRPNKPAASKTTDNDRSERVLFKNRNKNKKQNAAKANDNSKKESESLGNRAKDFWNKFFD